MPNRKTKKWFVAVRFSDDAAPADFGVPFYQKLEIERRIREAIQDTLGAAYDVTVEAEEIK